MSKIPSCSIWLSDAEKTHFCGRSLADTLYGNKTTILLNGQLGAGKTTFLQGFAAALGIKDHVTSPTYALEQRYKTSQGLDFLHLDLYRLNEKDAVKLVDETDTFEGIRCIEWAERLPAGAVTDHVIEIYINERDTGRQLDVTFTDASIPDDTLIDTWRQNAKIQPHIIGHCEAVASAAVKVSKDVIEQGRIVRVDALRAAGRLHDLFRFIDFRGNRPAGITETDAELQTWEEWKKLFPNHSHETACAAFVQQEGFEIVSSIIQTHGLRDHLLPKTVEQKLLYYADKRVIMDKFVTVEERFADFAKRYSDGKLTEMHKKWLAITQQIEKDLGIRS